MAAQYEIIDNFLDAEYFKKLKNIIFQDDFPWNYVDYISDYTDSKHFFFKHTIFEDNIIYSNLYQEMLPILKALNAKAIVRMRLNMTFRLPEVDQSTMHQDQTFPHKGAILYFNTTNGPTILEDGTKIDSIENRILKLNTYNPHAAQFSTDEKRRIVLNINYF
jgi:hypothetical protein